MANQNLIVNLDANAEQLFDALYNIDQSAKSASKSLEDIAFSGTVPIATIGPEWLADLYAAVSRAAPGIPWREFLDMPLAAATHLAAAAHRANGGRTERPVDWEMALKSIQ